MKKSILLIALFLCSLYIEAQTEFVNHGEINKVENYTDHFNITNGYFMNNNLVLEVLYGGGCSEHNFYYTINPQIVSDTLTLTIYHNANNDVCQAFIGQNLNFDLSVFQNFVDAKIIKVKSGNYTLALFPIINAKKINLPTAKSLIKNDFYKNTQDELTITEQTTDELWQKMGIQLFQIENKGSFVIQNNKVIDLGERPYTFYLDYVVCDLNRDGNYELYFNYQFGSGVSRGILGCYSQNTLFDIDQSCIIPSHETIANFKFVKKSDYNLDIYVQTPNKQIMNGTIIIDNNNKIVLQTNK